MSNTISFNLTVTHELTNLPLEALSLWFSPWAKSPFAMQEMVFMRTKCNRMEDFLALRNHMQSTSMLVQAELPWLASWRVLWRFTIIVEMCKIVGTCSAVSLRIWSRTSIFGAMIFRSGGWHLLQFVCTQDLHYYVWNMLKHPLP